MSTEEEEDVQTIPAAIESYKLRLHAEIERSRRRLARFEQLYEVSTAHFLEHMTAEDLPGEDMEYIEWAGEAKMLTGLQKELAELENVRHELS